MARHAKPPLIDNGCISNRKRERSRDSSDDDTAESSKETTPSKTSKSPERQSEDEGSESQEEDPGSESDVDSTPVKKTNISAAQSGDEQEDNYEVEALVDDRVIKGHIQYKVRWKGYGSEDDTWETEGNLNCPDLIEEYNESKADGKGQGTKRLVERSSDTESESSEAPTKKKKLGKPRGGRGQPPKKSAKNVGRRGKLTSKENPGPLADGEYKVSKIVDMRTLKTGKREFRVRWQGWSEKDDTWEPEENLSGNDKLAKFLEKIDAEHSDENEALGNRTAHPSKKTEEKIRESRRLKNESSDVDTREGRFNGYDPSGSTQGRHRKTSKSQSDPSEYNERQLVLEERKASIEERKLRLSEKRLEFDMNEREVRLSSEMEERKLLTQLSSSLQEQNKLIRWIADKLGYEENEDSSDEKAGDSGL